MIGSKRARPWIPSPSASAIALTSVAAAAAAFVLAALSLPGADALAPGFQARCPQARCLAPTCGARRGTGFGRQDLNRRAHSGPLLALSSTSVCDQQEARGDGQDRSTGADAATAAAAVTAAAEEATAAAATAFSTATATGTAAVTATGTAAATATAVSTPARESGPTWLPPHVWTQERQGTSPPLPPPAAVSVQHAPSSSPPAGGGADPVSSPSAVPSPAAAAVVPTPGTKTRQNIGQRGDRSNGGKKRWATGDTKENTGVGGTVTHTVSVGGSGNGRGSGSGSAGNNKRDGGGGGGGGANKKGYRRFRDNDVRMFLLERGLSQWEVRKVLPVIRRDPKLMTDIGVLAAKMQVRAAYS